MLFHIKSPAGKGIILSLELLESFNVKTSLQEVSSFIGSSFQHHSKKQLSKFDLNADFYFLKETSGLSGV